VGARFCSSCGSPLGATSSSRSEERKVVSVLFADLVGFTDGSERADPEDVRATLSPYFTAVKTEIERFGGSVEKFIGDAVMAVFGAPIAHEDDPERAVRAALRITDAITELNQGARQDLHVRVAVNTGQALVSLDARPSLGEGMVAGDVVNTASRLQSVAPSGGVVVGEITYRATRDVIEYEALEPATVKGKREAVPLWQATSARSHFGVDVEQAHAPFIAREHELDLLRNTFGRAASSASVQLVTITGEPGVGKSRLLGELRFWLDDQSDLVVWRQGRCLPYGEGITFWALGEVIKAQAGIFESDSPSAARDKLRAAVAVAVEREGDREWINARLGPLVGSLGSSGSSDRSEAFAAWTRFFEGLAARHPLVLVFEDLHWADDALLEFLEHLVEWSTGVAMLILCTARPELYESHPGWGGGRKNSTILGLSPLDENDTARLVSALSEAVLPPETQSLLLERSGGNPLYAEEFVRMLTHSGLLEKNSTDMLRSGEIPVPENVQGLISARIDTLSPEHKALLYDAALLGKVFWAGAVAAIGGRELGAVRQGLHELSRKEFIRPARTSSVEGETEHSFWHLLVRDVAYGQIPRAARSDKHLAAAHWIEAIAGERVQDQAELLAFHYEQALGLAEAAGRTQDLGQLRDSAARYLRMAGDRAFRLDFATAASLYRRALTLIPECRVDSAEIRLRLAEVAYHQGHYEDGLDLATQAADIAKANGDLYLAADALAGLGGSASDLAALGHWTEWGAIADEALKLLEGLPSSPELVNVLGGVAVGRMVEDRMEEAVTLADEALAILEEMAARQGEVEQMAPGRAARPRWEPFSEFNGPRSALASIRGVARMELGDIENGLEDLRSAIGISKSRGDVLGEIFGTGNLSYFLYLIRGPEAGLKMHRGAIELAESRAAIGFATWLRAECLWMLYDVGRWDELLGTAEALGTWAAAEGAQQQVVAASYTAQVLTRRGRTQEADSLLETLLAAARASKETQVTVPALTIAATVFSTAGDSLRALALVKEVGEVTQGTPAYRKRMLVDLVRVAISNGSADLTTGLIEDLRMTLTRDRHCLTEAQGLIAEAHGNLPEALELYQTAAVGWQEFTFPFERAYCLLAAGRCLSELARPEEAKPLLIEAAGLFSNLQAGPYIDEVNMYLRRVSASSS
jgi:class 3 adenylate cyclase/tetratricopeptide (TPR) repeat protein